MYDFFREVKDCKVDKIFRTNTIDFYLIIPTSTTNSPYPMIGGIASINETPQIVCTHRDDINLCGVAMYHELSYLRTDLQRIAVSTVIEYSELIPK